MRFNSYFRTTYLSIPIYEEDFDQRAQEKKTGANQ
jgi:hypothetical protein